MTFAVNSVVLSSAIFHACIAHSTEASSPACFVSDNTQRICVEWGSMTNVTRVQLWNRSVRYVVVTYRTPSQSVSRGQALLSPCQIQVTLVRHRQNMFIHSGTQTLSTVWSADRGKCNSCHFIPDWARGALQAGRSRVRLTMGSVEFFIDLILPAVTEMRPVRRADSLNTFVCWLSCNVGASTPCPALYRGCCSVQGLSSFLPVQPWLYRTKPVNIKVTVACVTPWVLEMLNLFNREVIGYYIFSYARFAWEGHWFAFIDGDYQVVQRVDFTELMTISLGWFSKLATSTWSSTKKQIVFHDILEIV
jgi:hypothetical protein